jgi:hypothetical protein
MDPKRIFFDECPGPNGAHDLVFCDELTSRPDQNLDDLE